MKDATEIQIGAMPKFVAAGTVIMRNSDVMGLVHKRIAQAQEEARDVGENGSMAKFIAVRHKIAAYMALLSDLRAVPKFLNETPAALAQHLEQGATAGVAEMNEQMFGEAGK